MNGRSAAFGGRGTDTSGGRTGRGASERPAGPVARADGPRPLPRARRPWASQILGDLGAEVWKIERPETGDDTRLWGPPFVQGRDGPSDAAYYLCANRNKRSVAIDFGTPEGAALVRRLAERADIVVENFKTGALARYGLDYASLSGINPGLIYCSVTGFGQTGPYASRGGYDFLIQGMSGLMSVTGRPDDEPGAGPIKVGLPVSDLFTGLYAATAILAALHHRTATGEGQHIDCALLDSQVAVLVNQGMNHIVGGLTPGRLGNSHPNVVPYREFQTADGHVLVACGNDGQFRSLCGLLNLPDLAADPRFSDNVGRLRDRRELEATLGAAIRQWTSADFFAAMEAGGGARRADQPRRPDPRRPAGRRPRPAQAHGAQRRHAGHGDRLSEPAVAHPRHIPDRPADPRRVHRDVLAALGVGETERARLREKGVIRD